MKFSYTIRQVSDSKYELRFPDFIGAREIFLSEVQAHQEAINVFLEAVQARFENKQRVPDPSAVPESNGVICVPGTFQELIIQHNLSMEKLSEIQDVNE